MSIRCRRLPLGVVNVLLQFTSKHANYKLQHEIEEVYAPVRATHDAFPSIFLYFCNGIVTFCLVLVNVRDLLGEANVWGWTHKIKESGFGKNAITALGGTDISMAGRVMRFQLVSTSQSCRMFAAGWG